MDRKDIHMSTKWLLAAALTIGIGGCAKTQSQATSAAATPNSAGNTATARAEEAEPGETKIKLEEAPAAVKQTIQRELVGAELEDIAKKQQHGKTVYETDIIRQGQKWEVVV